MTTATIVTETYNLAAGQSFEHLAGALRAAASAAVGAAGGPHAVLLMDASDDARTDALIDEVAATTGARMRHVRVPVGTPYDVIKDLGAELADTEVVLYLDGDCVPQHSPVVWLEAMIDGLERTGAPGVAGTTLYEGDGPLRFASSVLDFGFLLDHPGGNAGCYASNNVAFRREARVSTPIVQGALRCACYLHAQAFSRAGTPLRHVDDSAALVRHEFPPLLDERLRRGYDAVAVTWVDPNVIEARYFAGHRLRAATVGVARFLRANLARDRHRWREMRTYVTVSNTSARVAAVVIVTLRLLEVLGVWRALFLPRDERWDATVTYDEAHTAALASMRTHDA